MQVMPKKSSKREERIFSLAVSISDLMRSHTDRNEAIDAYDVARVLFRKQTREGGIIRRSSLALSTSP
jgi:hypothetical protein